MSETGPSDGDGSSMLEDAHGHSGEHHAADAQHGPADASGSHHADGDPGDAPHHSMPDVDDEEPKPPKDDPNAPKPILTAEGACQPPVIIPADSLTMTDSAHSLQFAGTGKDNYPFVSHIMDLDVDPESGLAYAVGLPGLFIFGDDEDGVFWHLGEWPSGAATAASSWAVEDVAAHGDAAEFNDAQAVGGGLVAITARGNPAPEFMFGPDHPPFEGLFIVDVNDPAVPELVAELDIQDASCLAWLPPILYVGSFVGDLWAVDLSVPTEPTIVGHLAGDLKTLWSMRIVDDVAFIADNSAGLAVVDLTIPTEPAFVSLTWPSSGAQDLVIVGDHLYLAVGADGIETFDVSSPESPQSLSVVDTGPSAVAIDGSEAALWVVNQESVTTFDISDPTLPVQVAVEETPFWALGVAADGLTAVVADWCAVHRYAYDPTIKGPEADLHPEALFFWDGAEVKTFELRNRGDGLLTILGAVPEDPRVTVKWDRLVVAPGDTATGFVYVAHDQFSEGEPALDTTVCLATNDPDEPLQQLSVAATSPFTENVWAGGDDGGPVGTSVTIGQPAPDFVLNDLDGVPHTLSDHLGQPILLYFFSTW